MVEGILTEAGKRRYGNLHSGTAAMTQQEIGDMFGVSLQSVQSVEKRALQKIQRTIERLAKESNMTVEEWLRS